MQQFINRSGELDFLNDEYNKISSSFVVIYGRRYIVQPGWVFQPFISISRGA